jgi:hypothetical protein
MIEPQRSEPYLTFIRQLPCLFCKRAPGGQAHHEGKRQGGGVSLKGCDFHTVPLCAGCHAEYHQRARIQFWSVEETQRRFARSIERTMKRWRTEHGSA